MQDLLEPQLVRLVDDDEKKLVVAGRVGERLLKFYQLGDLKILVVRKRRTLPVFG